ncbi:MAG: ParA family protein [Planctomycetota bacterium]
MSSWPLVLRLALDEVRDRYAFVILDCPPDYSKVTVNALVAADGLVIPTAPEFLLLAPLLQLNRMVVAVTKRLNPRLKIYAVLLTIRNPHLMHAREVEERLRALFPGLVFGAAVAPSVRFQRFYMEGDSAE